ncbi:hypothetical protein ACRAWF_46535 [Streptomyces sp. L7]
MSLAALAASALRPALHRTSPRTPPTIPLRDPRRREGQSRRHRGHRLQTHRQLTATSRARSSVRSPLATP